MGAPKGEDGSSGILDALTEMIEKLRQEMKGKMETINNRLSELEN